MHQATNPDLPNYVRPEVVKAQPDLDMIHDLIEGTRCMWEKARTYIRKWKDEDEGLYEIRSKIETVFGALERIVSASVGMLFAKAPTMTWNASETAMQDHWQDIDGSGTAGPVFVKQFSDRSITDGIGVIVVDHPSAPEGVQVTAANEEEFGLRPTWAMYERSQVLSWLPATVNNKKVLKQVVLHECSDEESGKFGVKATHRYRILFLARQDADAPLVATWALWEQTGDGTKPEHFQFADGGVFRNRLGKTRSTLPLRIAYTGRTDASLTAKPPLLGVAFANLAHWQKATNLSFYEDFSAFPQPVVEGELAPDPITGQPQKLRVGPGTAVHVTTGSSYDIKEMTGTAMEQLRKGLDEKLYRIASTAMSFLLPQTRAAETAEAKRLDAVAENSTLATSAQGIEDAVNGALEDHAWYLGIEKAGAPVITLSRDYETTSVDAQAMTAYAALVKEGFPKRLVLEALQAGGRITADADLDQLELEWEAGQAAAAEQQRIDQQNADPNVGTDPKALAA